ncbi:MAG: gamma carbonic anhydrase family protein [Granulosicoccus sp.]|nr:gamma carbonic anhydrase family protein [Granulosicoccus sp.]
MNDTTDMPKPNCFSLGERRVVTRGEHFIAPGSTLIGAVTLGELASIWFNVVIRADNDTVTIGDGSNVQDGSILHVDPGYPISIGKNVTVGHKVMLHGCSIGDGSLVGMNAVILNGAVVGKECLIGANALVTEGMEIPDRSLVLGSPAKIVKPLDERMLDMIASASRHYQERISLYREQLKPMA